MADLYRVLEADKKWSPPLSEKEIVDRIWAKQLRPSTRMTVIATGRLFAAQENPTWREAFNQSGVPCNPILRPAPPTVPARQKLSAEQIVMRGGFGLLGVAFVLWLVTLVFPGENQKADVPPPPPQQVQTVPTWEEPPRFVEGSRGGFSPRGGSREGRVVVHSYTRRDGTSVRGHTRRR